MPIAHDDFYETMELIGRVVERMAGVYSTPHDFGTGDLLHRAEIHTVQAIGDYPGLSVTALAKRLKVTKGAVSQMVGRLLKKKLVERTYVPGSAKETQLHLTRRGLVARKGHEAYHAKMHGFLKDCLGSRFKQRAALYRDVFTELESVLDQMESVRSRG